MIQQIPAPLLIYCTRTYYLKILRSQIGMVANHMLAKEFLPELAGFALYSLCVPTLQT